MKKKNKTFLTDVFLLCLFVSFSIAVISCKDPVTQNPINQDSGNHDQEDEQEVLPDNSKIIFTTSRAKGEIVKLAIFAEEKDQPHIWIDLNNNDVKDEGEAVTHFSDYLIDTSNYIIDSNTITIHDSRDAYACKRPA